MPLFPGTRLGLYEIVAPLGAGGMGEVHRARDTRLGRDVALKVLPADVASNAVRLARLEREARTVAGLNHPNIVTLYTVEDHDGTRFLTMELVEGQSLDRQVKPGGLPLAKVLDLAVPLADALAAAHERGVVHRDLKPANVMVTRDGRVKVLDFGLAKTAIADMGADATQAATVAAPLSSEGQVMGTVPYMAPEQIRGEAVDARTDLFALGILLYELLVGRRPFGGATSADVSSAILRDVPAPVRTSRVDLPADIERIVGRCLEKDPERRFQTAKDVRNELELVRRAGHAGPSTVASGIRPSEPVPDTPSIAVLPFASRSRDEEDEYFAEGLADELMSVLAKIRGLRVAARTSSAQFRGTSEDIAVIGHKLNVATLLEGSVRKSGNRVRISVQLVKVADGYHLWSETFDRTLDDIFAVQDDIAQAVVKELRTTLLGEIADSKASGEVKAEVAAAAVGRATNPEAYRLFLQARYFLNRADQEALGQAVKLFRRSLDLEPEQGLAWAYLSWALTYGAVVGHGPLEAGIQLGREAAARALALEPDLAEAHLGTGHIQMWHDFDLSAADRSFRRAGELAPGDAEALRAMAMIHLLRGRFEEALTFSLRAVERDPLSTFCYGALARVHFALGRFPEAVEAFRKALEISPQATSFRGLVAISLSEMGEYESARAEATDESTEWSRQTALAIIEFRAGRPGASREAMEALIATHSHDAAYQIAMVHAVRGEADAAFQWFERAYAQRDSGLLFLLPHRRLIGLEQDPRWKPLLEKLGLGA